MSIVSVEALIRDAMSGVQVILCARCRGWGKVGLPSLCCTCPECRGSGRTTTNERETCHT